MDEKTVREIEAVNGKVEKLKETNNRFLKHLRNHMRAERFKAELSVDDDSLFVPCFGHVAKASSRVVRGDDGAFALEYIFLADRMDENIELARFYLTHDEGIHVSLGENTFICDMTNSIIADRICAHVMYGALKSALFLPAATDGG